MNVLAFDTATPDPAVALLVRGEVFEERLGSQRHASEELLAAIERSRLRAEIEIGALERIAACSGPGSFTGVRIGLATAWGLGRALEIAVETVSTLEAMAEAARRPGLTRVTALLDAGRGEVILGAFGLEHPRAEPLGPIRRLSRENAITSTRDRARVLLPPELLGSSGEAPPGSVARALALAVAREARLDSSLSLRATYARPSAAEEKLGTP